MNEKRRRPRKRPEVNLQVTDTLTGMVVGRLGDVSLDGMLLLACTPIVDDALYQFAFHLPDVHGQLHPVEVGVHETWSEAARIDGQTWAGFRFIDVSPEGEQMLRDWLGQADSRT